MANKDDKLLVYFDDEAHLVRRLGSAVIACWVGLSPDIRRKLMDQAKRVMEDDDPNLVDEQMKRFIAEHTGSQ